MTGGDQLDQQQDAADEDRITYQTREVDAAEARSRTCCCSGVMFCTSSNSPALPARLSPSLSIDSCSSLGEKAWPSTTVINAHNSAISKIVMN